MHARRAQGGGGVQLETREFASGRVARRAAAPPPWPWGRILSHSGVAPWRVRRRSLFLVCAPFFLVVVVGVASGLGLEASCFQSRQRERCKVQHVTRATCNVFLVFLFLYLCSCS